MKNKNTKNRNVKTEPNCRCHSNTSKAAAFTLAEGRVDEVHFNTWETAKGGQIQDSEREAIQPIEKAGLEQQNTGLTPVKNLFPCLGFAPRSQSLACCAYAQAGSICSLSGNPSGAYPEP